MDQSDMNVNEYVRRLLSDKQFFRSEYIRYVDNGYYIDKITGILSDESLYAVICKARWNKKLRRMLDHLLWYIDGRNLSDQHFRMLLKFPRRCRNNYVGTLAHQNLSFYQMQILNRYPNSFEAFGWLFDCICSHDIFTEEDMLQLLYENSDVTEYGIQGCIDNAYQLFGSSAKLDTAVKWLKEHKQ